MLAEQSISSLICEAVTCGILGELKRPLLTGGLPPRKLKMVKDYVVAKLGQQVSLKELAALVELSEYHFQRNFKAQCGVSPHVWLTSLRIEYAKELMGKNKSLAEVADACAFSSQSHFSRTFKTYTGMSPGAYVRDLYR